MSDVDVFEEHRRLLFGVAYRLLGSVVDADDVVQETWLRWSAADRSDVRDVRAYLTTTASRLALNVLRAQRNRRETYVGPWLPEPMLTDAGVLLSAASDVAADQVLLQESVSMAFLVVLESLSPLERVAFVMHDLFGFDHAEIAEVLDRSEPAVRQLASRARRHVREQRPRFPTSRAEHTRVLEQFMRAAFDGDLESLLSVLAPDVVVVTDGGGTVKAALRPIHGADKAARFLVGISQSAPSGLTWELREVNAGVGALVHLHGVVYAAIDLDAAEGLATSVRVQLNPAKLASGPAGSAGAAG